MSDKIKVRTYRGVDIFIGGSEKSPLFVAEVRGQRLNGVSFDSLQQKLDKALGFEPRDLCFDSRDGVTVERIVGTEKYSHGLRFVKEDGDNMGGNVAYAPEARALLEERRRLYDESARVRQEYQDKADALNAKLNPFIVRPGGC